MDNRDISIKIDAREYLINMNDDPWLDTDLPVSGIYTDYQIYRSYFYLNICDNREMTKGPYVFRIGKKITVEFMGKMYSPWEEYELIKLHDALETELALANLEG